MKRSDWGVRVSVSVALLLAVLRSVTPLGAVILAMLDNDPVAEGLTWIVNVNVPVAFTGRSTVVAKAPAPLVGPVTVPPPLLPVAVQIAAVTPVGKASATLAPLTSLGPALLTTMM